MQVDAGLAVGLKIRSRRALHQSPPFPCAPARSGRPPRSCLADARCGRIPAPFHGPSEVQSREIKSFHCVLFGAQLSNPWIERYGPELNSRFRALREEPALKTACFLRGSCPCAIARYRVRAHLCTDRTPAGCSAGSPGAHRDRISGNPPKRVKILPAANQIGKAVGSAPVAGGRADGRWSAPPPRS
jgi:hypothetical protein